MDSLLLTDVRVVNYELIENKILSDIQIKADFVQISDYSMPPLSKSLLKLKLKKPGLIIHYWKSINPGF